MSDDKELRELLADSIDAVKELLEEYDATIAVYAKRETGTTEEIRDARLNRELFIESRFNLSNTLTVLSLLELFVDSFSKKIGSLSENADKVRELLEKMNLEIDKATERSQERRSNLSLGLHH